MNLHWDNRACLVTGGLGFGGSHLVAELVARSVRPVLMDSAPPPHDDSYLHQLGLRDAVELVTGDVRDRSLVLDTLRRYDIDTVFHLAAMAIVPDSITDPYETLDVNANGTFAVLEACRAAPAVRRLVFASSGAYYGDTVTLAALPETAAPLAAANLYASSKASADLAVQGYSRTYGIPAAVCRFMNTYGPGDRHISRLVPRALSLLAANEPFDFGTRDDGDSRLDFLYVGDMARAYIAVAEYLDGADGGAFNFGSGRATTVREVAALVSELYDGREREPLFRGQPRRPSRHKWLDISKAQSVLGWTPDTDLRDGLLKTIEWHLGRTGAAPVAPYASRSG